MRCGDGSCCGGMDRRTFVQALAAAGGLGLAVGLPADAQEPLPEDARLIPWEKNLDPAWVEALFARGEREVRRGEELRYIGMPVGGICCGTVYLGGDGKLWLWDIFNDAGSGTGVRARGNNGELYVKPLEQTAPFEQGFGLRVAGGPLRRLDRSGFPEVTFCGEYPIAEVVYRDPGCPVEVALEAYTPFAPLDAELSGHPAVVLAYTLTNPTAQPAELELLGWLENGIGCQTAIPGSLARTNRVLAAEDGAVGLVCSAEGASEDGPARPDIVVEDFEKETWEGWEVEGVAFGAGPVAKGDIPAYQTITRLHGERMANSHSTAPGADVGEKDNATGRLLGAPFTLERHFLRFRIGGGNNPGVTCLNLRVGDEIVATETGRNDNELRDAWFDLRAWEGQEARIEILDAKAGAWGNIGVDWIVLSDRAADGAWDPDFARDAGEMVLAVLADGARAAARVPGGSEGLGALAWEGAEPSARFAEPGDGLPLGAVGVPVTLRPGESRTVRFVVAWRFPNLEIPGLGLVGRHYAARFASAEAVARTLLAQADEHARRTRLWRDAWYRDSTLPHWFLIRTFANTSILATDTAYRFGNGRFYGWEGINCCAGTCGHVWHYGQAMGRVFPELERSLRERADLGVSLGADGTVQCRGEFGGGEAIDGEAAVVLRALREHQMSPDDGFLRRNWDGLRRVLRRLLAQDPDQDGILEGRQENTLDAAWFGKIPWISGMYLAALRAGSRLARVVGDESFAARLDRVADAGYENIEQLFDGEYYIQIEDPAHADAVGVGAGCHIDQVLGQSWAFQVGLPRVMRESSVCSALRSMWKYAFCQDVGPYREKHTAGRPYALAGDAGLLMCTWPKPGHRTDWSNHWQYGYFNECMSGFEHQAASHMIWEGMLLEGLAVERAIHDRYHPRLRNPWNEIECSDHYARAMASYGVFLAACGWEYDGPAGRLGFAPKLRPEDFRAAFTAAEGWGSIAQRREGARQTNRVEVLDGRLVLRSLVLERAEPVGADLNVAVSGDADFGSVTVSVDGTRVSILLGNEVTLEAGQALEVETT